MKKIVTAFLLFSFSINLASSLEGSKVSNSRIKMLNGKYAKLSKYYEDGPVIINFWTTWWPLCGRQLAYLDQLNTNFKDAGLQVLAVNANKPNVLKLVRPYIEKRKYKFPVSVDPSAKLAKKLGVLGYPTLFIVGRDGTILHKSNGYTEGLENEYLQELLKYLDSENIDYGDFEYERQLEEKNDVQIALEEQIEMIEQSIDDK